MLGDCGTNMSLMLPMIKNMPRADWLVQCAQWKKDFPMKWLPSQDPLKCKPQQVRH